MPAKSGGERGSLDKLARSYLRDLRKRAGRKSLSRIEGFLDNLVGAARLKPEDPRQRGGDAGLLWVPGLTARPWHDPASIPWLAEVRDAYPELLRESRALRAAGRFRKSDEGRVDFTYDNWEVVDLQALDLYAAPGVARAIPIFFHENLKRAPRAAALLRRFPVVADCFYSMLNPGGAVRPHWSSFNAKLFCHLGLEIPEDCAMRVADEVRPWRERELTLFDDTFEHETWKRSQNPRVLFHIGVWHPDLTPFEIAAFTGWFRLLERGRKRAE